MNTPQKTETETFHLNLAKAYLERNPLPKGLFVPSANALVKNAIINAYVSGIEDITRVIQQNLQTKRVITDE